MPDTIEATPVEMSPRDLLRKTSIPEYSLVTDAHIAQV
jgi:hypothetical protein